MALLTKSSSYQKYLERIEEYRSITNKDHAFSGIQARTENLLNELKTRDDKNIYFYLLTSICALSILSAIPSFMSGYYLIGVLLLVSPFVAWYFYSQLLKDSIEQHAKIDLQESKGIVPQLIQRIQYLKQGIQIKITRIHVVRLVYMLVFPLLMLAFLEMFKSGIEVNQILLVLIAFTLGSGFWFYYFKDEMDELEYEQKELEEYLNSIIQDGQALNYMSGSEVDKEIQSERVDLDSEEFTTIHAKFSQAEQLVVPGFIQDEEE